MEKMGPGSSASSQSDAGLTESCDPVAGAIPYPSAVSVHGLSQICTPLSHSNYFQITPEYERNMDSRDGNLPTMEEEIMFANRKQGASE